MCVQSIHIFAVLKPINGQTWDKDRTKLEIPHVAFINMAACPKHVLSVAVKPLV